MSEKDAEDVPSPSTDTLSEAKGIVEDRSNRLREAARRVGSNRALSAKSGVPISTLNTYLAGQEPKIGSLQAIAEASGLSFEWLATGQHPKPDRTAPFKMFAAADMDLLAEAIEEADKVFTSTRGAPTWRERAQAIALIYDMINSFDRGREDRNTQQGK